MTDLGGLGGSCTVATDLNERGQVVGQSWLTGDLAGHAFRWDGKNGLVDLGTLGGDFSSATAINGEGRAVGGSYLPGNVRIEATLWNRNTAIDLGVVDSDQCSYALFINARKQVVGISGTANCESTRAFLWEHGAPMVDLNSLVSSKSGMYVASASAINDRGEIAGLGVLPSGDEHAVLLIPCREGEDQGCETDATSTPAPLFNPSSRPRPSPLIVPRRNFSRFPRRPSNRIRIPGLGSPATSAIPKMAAAASDPKASMTC
jgi:probable HAF family extracellular repeat protein